MTARCVHVVQIDDFPPCTNLEKDVPPSVLSSGDALILRIFCNAKFSGKSWRWRIIDIEPDNAPKNVWPFNHQLGSVPAPQYPKAKEPSAPFGNLDQKGRFCSPLGTPSTNRSPFGCRERFSAQTRPLFRQWKTTKEISMDAMEYY